MFLLLISSTGFAQHNCCIKPEGYDAFALMATDKKFITLHEEPEPFTLQNPLGTEISFKTTDDQLGYGYMISSDVPTTKYVFVIHEWWGLNDYIKQESQRIFHALGNVNVIALDLYDKKVATLRDSASKYVQSLKPERAQAIIKGAIAYVGGKADIATIGWCFGGGWSLQAALLGEKQVKACVMYYGMPENNLDKLKALSAPVLFVFADRDESINKEVLAKFEANMKALGKKLEVKKYDAVHAFANPSNPKYVKEYADDAFKNAIEFIKPNLK